MQIDPWIFSFSAATVIATIWMGFWSARRSKTAHDFYVAGRTVSVGWNASAISGEYLSAASFMGVAGMVMSSGYDALWYPVCYACGYLFLLLFIAGPLRRFGAYTIPDFAEGRFDSPLFRKIAVVFVLFIGFFYTMPQMKGAGTTLAYIFPGLPYWAGVVLVGAVITLNVALGGMKGITLVQAFQYWAKMFAISVPVFVLMSVYGHYGKQIGSNREVVEGEKILNAINADEQLKSSFQPIGQTIYAPNIFGLIAKVKAIFNPPLKLNWRQMGGTSSSSNVMAHMPAPLFVWQSAAGKTVLWNTNLASMEPFLLDVAHTSATTDAEMTAKIEAGLKSNGVTLVSLSDNIVLAIASSEAARMLHDEPDTSVLRKPLPEKAPKDSTWISPFGPLTTKAAKAAKPKITYDGPLLISPLSSAIEDFLPRIFNKVSGGKYFAFNAEQAYSFLPTNHSAFNLVLTSTMERQFTRRISEIRYGPQLTNLFISWPSEPRLIKAKDFPKEMHSVLESNGVTVIDDGRVVTAFLTRDAKIIPVNSRPYALLYTYSLIIALVCGTAGLPHILVRFYTNPDGVAAKRTTMWVMILIGVFYLFPPIFGVMGRNLMPQLYEGVGAKGTDKVVLELPKVVDRRGELYEPLKSSSEKSQGVAELRPPNKGIPWGSILSGITCAGAFAAFMSTFSGLLVSMTGALAHDVYGRMLRPKSTPLQRMLAFKICAVICGAGAILLGFLVETFEINKMVGWAFAIAATSYFPLLFLSAWWRGITMKGAAIGMLAGGTLSLVVIASTMFADQAAWAKPLADFYAAHPLLRILAEQPAIWALPLAIFLMIVISKLTRKDIPADIRMKMLVLHAPEKLGLKQEYIQEHQGH